MNTNDVTLVYPNFSWEKHFYPEPDYIGQAHFYKGITLHINHYEDVPLFHYCFFYRHGLVTPVDSGMIFYSIQSKSLKNFESEFKSFILSRIKTDRSRYECIDLLVNFTYFQH